MAATREQLFRRLEALGIETTTIEHAPVATVAESHALLGHLPGAHCKSLFIKDKKKALWLIVSLDRRPLDLNALSRGLDAPRFSFGSPELLWEVLGVMPGSVSPFALINDTQKRVKPVLDAEVMGAETVNFHPLKNDATTAIRPDDLRRFVADCGHRPIELDLTPFERSGEAETPE